MQAEIVNGHSSEPVKVAISNIHRLITWARNEGVPVVYTCVAYRVPERDSPQNSRARTEGILREGSPGSQIIAELAPSVDDSVVIKRRVGAFYGTDLELLLRSLGVQRLIVTGSSTPRAVESTVREAHSRDIPTLVVSDALLSPSADMHRNSLSVMGKWFADVMTTERAIAHVSGAK